jgi:glyoxylase I family protein
LRHLTFAVADVDATVLELQRRGVTTESVRIDEYTGRRFTVFTDPDGLPLQIYEVPPR